MNNVEVAEGRRLKQGDKNTVVITKNLADGEFYKKQVSLRDKIASKVDAN